MTTMKVLLLVSLFLIFIKQNNVKAMRLDNLLGNKDLHIWWWKSPWSKQCPPSLSLLSINIIASLLKVPTPYSFLNEEVFIKASIPFIHIYGKVHVDASIFNP